MQIGDRLPDCQIETLDIRRVRMRRILRFIERPLQSSGRADNRSTFHSRDAVFSPSLDHLGVDASNTEQLTDYAFVELEAIRHNQWNSNNFAAKESIIEQGFRVGVAAPPDDR